MERMTLTKRKILMCLLEAAPDGELIAPEIGDDRNIQPGSLYPAIYQLVEADLVDARWSLGDGDERPRKLYRLTPNGVVLARAYEQGTVEGAGWRQFLPGALGHSSKVTEPKIGGR